MADQANAALPEPYAGYEPFTDEAYFNCGAEELATKLLGRYLYGPRSDVMLRIVETEAYPYGDTVYDVILGGASEPFPKKAGVLLRLSAALHYRSARHSGGVVVDTREHLYITAGGMQAAKELVLIRSCEPHVPEVNYLRRIEGLLGFNEHTPTLERETFLLRPDRVAAALANDVGSNPVLYEAGGVELYKNAALKHPLDPDYVIREPTKSGIRVLHKSKFYYPKSVLGYWDKLRFALLIEKFHLYEEWSETYYTSPVKH